jgi:hypothetical protein
MKSMASIVYPSNLIIGELNLGFSDKGKAIPNKVLVQSIIISNFYGEILSELVGTENSWVKISGMSTKKGDIIQGNFCVQFNEPEISEIRNGSSGVKVKINMKYSNPFGIVTTGEYVSWFILKDRTDSGYWSTEIKTYEEENYEIMDI